MHKKPLEIIFDGLNLHENGNLLFISRIIIYEALVNNHVPNKLDELLDLIKIKRPTELVIRDIDEFLQHEATIFDIGMKKINDGLDDVPFLRPYLALFWQYKYLLNNYHNINLDNIFERNRENINIDFFNSLPKINIRILFSVLSFHYSYLKLKENEQNEKLKYDDDFYLKNSRTTLRAVEILINLQFLYNININKLYFQNIDDDLITNFINIIKKHPYEKESYFIKRDKTLGNYIHYTNKLKPELNFKLNSSRIIKKGESRNNKAINQNIINYLGEGLNSYIKLIKLKLKKERVNSIPKSSYGYEIQATQIESFYENINKSIKTISTPYENDELAEINSKPRLSKRAVPKSQDELEEDKTIENPTDIIPNSFNQLRQNRAYSALITKERLLLPNNYNIPEINIYKEFIKHVVDVRFSDPIIIEDVFNSIFLITVLTGFNYDDVYNIFLKENKGKTFNTKTGIVELNLHSDAISTINNDIFFEKANKKISYIIPGLYINLIGKIQNDLTSSVIEYKDLSEEKYKLYIKNKIKSFSKTISFDYNKTWYFLISYLRSKLKEDITSLFGMSKKFQNDESKLAYGSSAKDSIIYSNFLKEIYDELNLETIILKLYKWSDFKNKVSLNNDREIRVGSNRAIAPQKVKDFFYKLNQRIEYSNDKIERFNLLSIYTRISLGILLGTRTFENSCSLSRVCFTFHILGISEKSNTLLSGIRQIPLCEQAESIIINYQRKAVELNVPKEDIYLIDSLGNNLLYNVKKDEIKKILESLNLDKYVIDFLYTVPLNVGRHIVSKYAIEENSNGQYLEAFLGHYASGAEQFGTFSNLNFKHYIDTMRKFLSHIANIYGIY